MTDNQQLTQLTQAIDTLYGNSDPSLKDQANSFLLTFQRSEDAWKLVFPILGDESTSLQLRVFMAQTLRSKVQYDFSQLPKESLVSLKDSLIQLLIAYNGKSRLITTQLCISLTYFALQFLEWSNAVQEIINLLSPNSMPTLLEFLTILPQETMDVKKTPLTDEEFDTRTKQLISNNVEQVLYIMSTLAETRASNASSINTEILSCIKSWIVDIPFFQILNNEPICSLIFEGISNEDTFDTAVECLTTIISETDVSPDSPNLPC
ncbi:unnamed protein product [Ambrosiozyma monospora]|uniref:Unnamed protein product n=1 Tax=Ambrosiozyma monospora TaxID=43982 RepID=A0ACB5T5V4_AMBMO|nr:unnamed protein product [Ambrosiozyma monospora]